MSPCRRARRIGVSVLRIVSRNRSWRKRSCDNDPETGIKAKTQDFKIERGGKTVRMTEEAQSLLPRIERILRDISEVETTARRRRPAMEGRFRLGIIPTVAPYLLPHVLPELKRHFPALQLELREAVTSSLVEDTATRSMTSKSCSTDISAQLENGRPL